MSTKTKSVNGYLFRLNYVDTDQVIEIELGDRFCGTIGYGDKLEERLVEFLKELTEHYENATED